ncbi:MAG: hypothetical protein Q8P33_00260 [bacterium]|nr:hypothetical protein [bacterium]
MTYEELPPRIQEYLGSHYTTLKNLRMASRYRIPEDKIQDFARTLGEVFLQNLTLEQFPAKLTEQLKLSQGMVFSLAADCAEQHFVAFEDFLGPSQPLVQQWRTWAREFGGKRPSDKASPEIERMISGAGQRRGGTMEFLSKTKRRPPTAPARTAPSPKPTVGQRVAERRAQQQQVERDQALPRTAQPVTQASPEARQKFLTQIRGLSVDALRRAGQPADQRIGQVAQKIEVVLQGAPSERQAIAQTLRQSPLYTLYHQIGQESIRTGQPLDMVIYQRYQQGQPYLLKEEFDAVAQLFKSTN